MPELRSVHLLLAEPAAARKPEVQKVVKSQGKYIIQNLETVRGTNALNS